LISASNFFMPNLTQQEGSRGLAPGAARDSVSIGSNRDGIIIPSHRRSSDLPISVFLERSFFNFIVSRYDFKFFQAKKADWGSELGWSTLYINTNGESSFQKALKVVVPFTLLMCVRNRKSLYKSGTEASLLGRVATSTN
jgi:hypothetical protein